MLLNNPNYLNELLEEEQRIVRRYETVYEKYRQEAYEEAITQSEASIQEFQGEPLIPKFKFIKALSVGALTGQEAMKVELDSLISQHPGTEESAEAQQIIDYMFVAFPVIKEAEEAREAEEIYTQYDPGQPHYVLLALDKREDVNQVNFNLLNYNLDNFNQYALEIDRLNLNDNYYMLAVKTFNNADGAMRYLREISNNSGAILEGIIPSRYRLMVISLDNFTVLSEKKESNPYYLFYQNHYQNQE
jgi:hypothetical protein